MARKTGGEERAAALQRLKAALKTGDVGNFYVFFGEEAFLKEHYWRMLEKKPFLRPAAAVSASGLRADGQKRPCSTMSFGSNERQRCFR